MKLFYGIETRQLASPVIGILVLGQIGHNLPYMLRYLPLVVLLIFPACASGNDGSHLPRPWEVPGAVIGGGIENSLYKARRQRVKAHIAANFDAIMAEMPDGNGPALERAFELAKVRTDKRPQITSEVLTHSEIYLAGTRPEQIEKLTLAFMVHGD